MIPLRPNGAASRLPPMRLERRTGLTSALPLRRIFVLRSLVVAAAMALPAMELHFASQTVRNTTPASAKATSVKAAVRIAVMLPSPETR